jgi:hypothetical protein
MTTPELPQGGEMPIEIRDLYIRDPRPTRKEVAINEADLGWDNIEGMLSLRPETVFQFSKVKDEVEYMIENNKLREYLRRMGLTGRWEDSKALFAVFSAAKLLEIRLDEVNSRTMFNRFRKSLRHIDSASEGIGISEVLNVVEMNNQIAEWHFPEKAGATKVIVEGLFRVVKATTGKPLDPNKIYNPGILEEWVQDIRDTEV